MTGKNYLAVSCAVIFSLSAFFMHRVPAVSATQKESVSRWAGTWEASAGEIISVTEKDGFLDILGKDSASIYTCTGIIEGNSVLCYGSGMNHEINQRFIYRSQLKLSADGLEETWEAGFATGKEIKWLKGKTIFKRKKTQSK